jgi:hypothetical protein
MLITTIMTTTISLLLARYHGTFNEGGNTCADAVTQGR